MFEMLVFIFGVYALVFGGVRLPWNLSLSGWRARAAGLLLMAPLPILILLGQVANRGIDSEAAMAFYGIMEIAVTFIGILGAAGIAYFSRKSATDHDPADEE
jgi:hypothetical protein